MTILMTGSTGFLGKAVVERLCVSGASPIRCLVRPNSDLSSLNEIQSRYPAAQIEYVVGNLLSAKQAYDATKGAEMVIHLAAETRGLPSTVFANTVVASKNLLEGVVRHRVRRVVLVSSLSVYGVASLPRGTVVTEETLLEENPEARDVYSFSKVRQDRLFQEYRTRHPFELVILRPGVLYGDGCKSWPSRAGLRLGAAVLEIAGRNQVPFTNVNSCAAAVAMAGGLDRLPEGFYNVIDDDLLKVTEYVGLYHKLVEPVVRLRIPFCLAIPFSFLLEQLHILSRKQVPLLLSPYRLRTMWGGHVFSNQKLKAHGWKPVVATREGVVRALCSVSDTNLSRLTEYDVTAPSGSPLASTEELAARST